MKVLILGSHCDDIELGCGGTLHKHHKDWCAHCAVLSSRPGLEPVARATLRRLGATETHFRDFVYNDFPSQRQEIWEFLKNFQTAFAPDLVLTQEPDDHQDHETLYRETVRVFRQTTLATYLVAPSLKNFAADTYEGLSGADVAAKKESLAAYRDFYPGKNYLEWANVEAQLRAVGVYPGLEFAESFRTVTRRGL